MPDNDDGTLERIDGGYVLRFQRRYASSVEEVWDALTRPERLQEWIGSEIELELVAGGRLVSRTSGPPEVVDAILAEGGSLETHDTVVSVEAGRVFEHTFGGSPDTVIRWELSPDGDGCLLRLTHTERVDRDGAQTSSYLAGWHDLLDALGQLLAGEPPSHSMEQWEANKARYDALISVNRCCS